MIRIARCRIAPTERAGGGAPIWPNVDFISSIIRSMTWPGPSAPSAPRPHRKALPAKAASAPSATARTTSRPERMPESSITVARPPTARDDGRKHVDRRRQALDLASAMVRHHDAVDPERHAFFGVGGMQDPLHHQRALPALAIARDLIPGEGAAHLAPHELGDLVHVGVVGGVGLEVAEARLAVSPAATRDSRARSECRRSCADPAGTAR